MQLSKEQEKTIDRLIIDEMTRLGTVGTSLGIIYQENLIYTKNYGAMDFENRIPPNSDTLFNIASVSKSFICMGILKLSEQGKLSLDDPITNYIDIELGFSEDPIRIKHLMSHTSGIPDVSDWLLGWNYEEIYGLKRAIPKVPLISWSDVLVHVNSAHEFVTEKPMVRFYYNNMAYGLLGLIIETISGMKYQEYIKNEILDPIGMKRSGFKVNGALDQENVSKCYTTDVNSKFGRVNSIEYPIEEIMDAAGGIFSSVNDLAKYVALHLKKGKLNDLQLISSPNIEAMQDFHFVESHPNTSFTAFYGLYGKTGYGFGFVINEDFCGTKLVQHSGSYTGASSWIAFLPEKSIGVVMLSNKHPSPRIFAQAILMELLGINTSENFHISKLRNYYNELIGKYQSFKQMDSIEVVNEGSQLYCILEMTGEKFALIPTERKYHFYVPTETGGKMVFEFEINLNCTWIHFERNKWKKA